jgi:hypothetical protein
MNISQNKCEIFTFSLGYRLAKMAYLPSPDACYGNVIENRQLEVAEKNFVAQR